MQVNTFFMVLNSLSRVYLSYPILISDPFFSSSFELMHFYGIYNINFGISLLSIASFSMVSLRVTIFLLQSKRLISLRLRSWGIMPSILSLLITRLTSSFGLKDMPILTLLLMIILTCMFSRKSV